MPLIFIKGDSSDSQELWICRLILNESEINPKEEGYYREATPSEVTRFKILTILGIKTFYFGAIADNLNKGGSI